MVIPLDRLFDADQPGVELPNEVRQGRQDPARIDPVPLLPDGGKPFVHLRHHRLGSLKVGDRHLSGGRFVIRLDIVEGAQRGDARETDLAAFVADACELIRRRNLRADPGHPPGDAQ